MKCCIRPAGLSTDFTGTTTKEAWEEEALDEHWNRFKGNVGKTSETGWSAYGLFRARRFPFELNWTEQQK